MKSTRRQSVMKRRQLKTKRLLAAGIKIPSGVPEGDATLGDGRNSPPPPSPSSSPSGGQYSPAHCRQALLSGVVCTKINSYNRKTRCVYCDKGLAYIVWKSSKARKQHYNLGSVPTSELRSVRAADTGNRIKLTMDSRTLVFAFKDEEQCNEWTACFTWLLSHVDRQRLGLFARPDMSAGPPAEMPGATSPIAMDAAGDGLPNVGKNSTRVTQIGEHSYTRKRASTVGNMSSILSTSPIRPLSLRSELLVRNTSNAHDGGSYKSSAGSRALTVGIAPLADNIQTAMTKSYDNEKIQMFELVAMLFEGQLFSRYKPGQKTKQRFVWFSFLLDNVLYSISKVHRDTTRPRGNLATMDIIEVVDGGSASVRKDIPAGQEVFSIVTRDAALHLSTNSAGMRHRWVQALRFAMWLVRHQDGKVEEFYFWYCNRGDMRPLPLTRGTKAIKQDHEEDDDEEDDDEVDEDDEDVDDDNHSKNDNENARIKFRRRSRTVAAKGERKETDKGGKMPSAPYIAVAPGTLLRKGELHTRSQSVTATRPVENGRRLAVYKDLTAPNFSIWLEMKRDTVALSQIELIKSLHVVDQRVNDLASESGQSREIIIGTTMPWEGLMKHSIAELQQPYQQFQQCAKDLSTQ